MGAAILLAIGIGLEYSAPAWACSCGTPPPPHVARQKASAVFEGRALRTIPLLVTSTVTFRLRRSWKGVAAGATSVTLVQGFSGCAMSFTEGRDYLVYAYITGAGTLSVSPCSRTRESRRAASDIVALGMSRTHPTPHFSLSNLLPLAGAAALSWLLLRRKKPLAPHD
jgi:hypothetical protein